MPIRIPDKLPAAKVLASENIFTMNDTRATTQDIRPLQILVLNLMPTKVATETQLARLLGNTPLQVELELMQVKSHESKNTSKEHMLKFYTTFDKVRDRYFDGMIITGAPVELMDFEEVEYWHELCSIMEWSRTHVYSTFHICWGAQAALYYYYGINKHLLDKKLFGVYNNVKCVLHEPLLKGMDDAIRIPHSRHTAIDEDKLKKCPDLEVLVSGEKCGPSIIKSKDNRRIFLTGHSEYDRETLEREYLRDKEKGLEIAPPENYYNADGTINMSWGSTANLLYYNWLNYYVYQVTPFEIDTISK